MSKAKKPVTFNKYGAAEWTHKSGDRYVVTGIDRDGRRFPAIVTGSWPYASGINLLCGSVWLQRDGRRHLIRRVGW